MDTSPRDQATLSVARTETGPRTGAGRLLTAPALSTVDIVVPVRRGDPQATTRIRDLHDVARSGVPLPWTITIVDVGGVGEAARRRTGAGIVVLLEVDTPADALVPLVEPLVSGRADVVVGSGRGTGRRGYARRAYDGLLRLGFGVGDTRGGPVAARADALRPLLYTIKRGAAFLGTELVLLARHHRLRVREVPIDPAAPRSVWRHILTLIRLAHAIVTGRAEVAGLAGRVESEPPLRAAVLMKFALFGIVGALSGVLYVLVYLPLREFSSPAIANFVALIAAALFNIEGNRAWTFRKAKVARVGMHVRSALLFIAHYCLTTGAVVLLLVLDPGASKAAEVITLLSADLLMTVARFVGLDKWVFRWRAR